MKHLKALLLTTTMALTLPTMAATTFEEDLAKLKLKHATRAAKERLKAKHKQAKDKLKIEQKLELLRLETDLATKQATTPATATAPIKE
jgi:membrane carboxypeptidase/penicillin-binding protein